MNFVTWTKKLESFLLVFPDHSIDIEDEITMPAT